MKLSLTKILIVAGIIFMSVAIGNISTIIKVDSTSNDELTLKSKHSELNLTRNENDTSKRKNNDDLVWFLQVSDIHISIFRDIDRVTELEEFCNVTITAINPSVVLATGDLTDAKNIDSLGSRQYEDEWKLYRGALDKCEVTKKTVWLDVRGNHDNFNVPGPLSKENYYRNYSIQGGSHPRSYLHSIVSPSGKVISFIALDACLEPGPKRPFNFFGLVNKHETDHLRSLIQETLHKGSSHSVWFGHYPTSCILSAEQGVRNLISSDPGVMAYMCGHLHSMGGLLPQMYTLQQAGFLELELADWKDGRMYRLAAIDHGSFSFIDIHHREWPVALITNPKHALFHIPGRERQTPLAHIRILAFSTSEITSVKVKLNKNDWKTCSHVRGPLYVAAWDFNLYTKGLHHIKVEVLDKAGRQKIVEQPFTLDGTRLNFDIWPRLLLMSNVTTVFQALFGLSIFGCIVPLSLLRLLSTKVKAGYKQVPTTSFRLIRNWYRRLWILANLDSFYYPLILYPLYITVGPWAVGEIIEDHIGVIFAWGIFINGAYLPGSFTYGYAFFQMFAFQFPLTVILAYKLDKRLETASSTNRGKILSILRHWWTEHPLYIILTSQLLFLYFFWLSYGTLAILLGPFRSWPLINICILWKRLRTIPLQDIKETATVFEEANARSSRIKTSHCI